MPTPDGMKLTPKQQQVLELMADGLSNIEIGARLFMAENTAKHHTMAIFATLRARNRTHAVSLGWRYGLLRADLEAEDGGCGNTTCRKS